MKTIFSYASAYRKAVTIALILMVVELIVELVQPIIMAVIIDEGIMKRDFGTIVLWGGVLLGLTILAFAAGIINSFYASEASQGAGFDLRKDLFEKAQAFSAQQIERFASSSLITRMTNDVTQVQAFIFMSLRIMLRAPLFIIGGLIMAFTVHVELALILLATVPFLLIFMLWLMTKGVQLFRQVQIKIDKINSIIQENLLGMRLIKSFDRGDHEGARFQTENNSLMDKNKKALQVMEATMPVMMLGMNLGIIAILAFGAVELDNGTAQAGEVVAIINYATRMLGSFGVFSFLLMNFSRGRASADRISEVLSAQASEPVGVQQGNDMKIRGKIEFNQVTFHYPGVNQPALKDVSFIAGEGSVVGIIGETGSGKTSLVQLLLRLYDPTSGAILLDGRNIKEMDLNSLRAQIGLATQEAHIFTGSIKENLLWGNRKASTEDIMDAAKDACIHDFIMSLPEKYETIVGQRGINLSGGQKQRLSLARVLVKNPKILIMDDSTSALDAKTEANVLRALEKRDCSMLIIAQKMTSVRNADQILLMKNGGLSAAGNHQQLMDTSKLYAEMNRSQVKEKISNVSQHQ
ncbi:ABC transporter ATP-binding protein [Sediminibacillus massiliensis]|uniref:ABC transporter ATP-binding protein n=1 Tax=Sediminibacillus massiliensis TaxID=1926277 RepID=UPI0009888EA2|nr:ABC transporter ATP-binding protein [Sediminibacillus massiliensis]